MIKELSALPTKNLRAVFSDLDGTLTEGPYLPAEIVSDFWELKRKGYWLVIVSGRPAGWADCLMRLLPLDAMIFENGAGWMARKEEKIVTEYLAPNPPSAQQAQLRSIFQKVQARIPHAKLATDQPFRLFDMAIDFAEELPHLSEKAVELAMGLVKQEPGITAKLSSIHINYWYGDYTKVSACKKLLAIEGKERNLVEANVVFTGDSPNDEPLFEFFTNSVGVANVKHFLSQMTAHPKYVSQLNSSRGFHELASRLNAIHPK